MKNIVIFGAPGSGKGTQSDKMIEKYGFEHISTGDVLRSEMKNDTELGKTAKQYIDQGQLVPDQLIVDMLASVYDSFGRDHKGVIFDGFPRTLNQAVQLERLMKKRGDETAMLIDINVPEDELIRRLLERGKTSGCSDDIDLDIIKERLVVYHEQTRPVDDYYELHDKYARIQGLGTISEIFGRISRILNKIY